MEERNGIIVSKQVLMRYSMDGGGGMGREGNLI